MNRPRVLIADDQLLVRSGLAGLLTTDGRVEVVGQAADGAEAVRMATELRPDVVLMDLRMVGVDGVEATRLITSELPGVNVLVVSGFGADSFVIDALKAGASGYLLKDSGVDAIVSSIVAVTSGENVMTRTVAQRVLEMLTTMPKQFYDGLTEREVEILRLLAQGLANKQIAYRLRVSDKTVRNHISNLYRKLGIADRTQAVLYAVRKGLVEA
jgi:DNA-binding NarL/FixJ family response regulator